MRTFAWPLVALIVMTCALVYDCNLREACAQKRGVLLRGPWWATYCVQLECVR